MEMRKNGMARWLRGKATGKRRVPQQSGLPFGWQQGCFQHGTLQLEHSASHPGAGEPRAPLPAVPPAALLPPPAALAPLAPAPAAAAPAAQNSKAIQEWSSRTLAKELLRCHFVEQLNAARSTHGLVHALADVGVSKQMHAAHQQSLRGVGLHRRLVRSHV